MNRILILLLILATFKLSAQQGGDYYVAPDGDDNNPGTFTQPWLTLQKAFDEVTAGDTVYLRGGIYNAWDEAELTTTGTFNNPIVFEGYPPDIAAGNWPVFDCKNRCDSLSISYNNGIYLFEVEYIELRCFEVKNVFQCSWVNAGAITAVRSANITYERLRVHQIGTGRGFYHTCGAWSEEDSAFKVDHQSVSPSEASPIFDQPDTTRWINCDVWDVMDTLENPPGNASDPWLVFSYNGN